MATDKSTKAWILTEFKDFSCGDKRLDNRFVTVATNACENPAAPINQASEDWAAAKATYRFFNNPKVDRAEMFKSHQRNTINRMKKLKVVLAIQDSSYLDFTKHTKLKGKGPIGTRLQNLSGYVMHSTFAASVEGLPLGLLTQDLWAREDIAENRNAKNRKLPVEQKESYKWIKALEEVNKLKSDDIELITIADRESDFYEFFETAERLNEKVIIRARYDRALIDSCEINEDNYEEDEADKENKNRMWDFMQKQAICFTENVEVSRNHVQIKGKNKKEVKKSRIAEVEIRVGQVTFNPPSKKQSPITYNLVFIKEVNPPEGSIPLEWMLITNLSIETNEAIANIVKYYRMRWMIEEYHKILKTGCTIEDCLLEDTEAMFLYITLFSIIAWRIFWITRLQRINPDAPCTEAVTEDEWKAIYCFLNRTNKPPNIVPTIREVVIWIARLGGFLARKGDGEPGIITIWRGWSRLYDIVSTYQVLTGSSEGESWD